MKSKIQENKKDIILLLLVIIIIVMAGGLYYPKIKDAIGKPYYNQGIRDYQLTIINAIVQDLNNQGYTTLTIGNQSIRLGLIK